MGRAAYSTLLKSPCRGWLHSAVCGNGRKGARYEKKYRNSRIGSLAVGIAGLGAELFELAAAAATEWLFEFNAECNGQKRRPIQCDPECT